MEKITAKVLRVTEVDITELTKKDFELLDKEPVVVIAVGLIQLLKAKDQEILSLEQQLGKQAEELKAVNDTKVAPEAEEAVGEEATPIKTARTPADKPAEGTVGFKHGVTSKYHYVSFNKASRKRPWQAALKIDKKQTSKYFETELEAAVAVDRQLDFMDDKRRPRNADEFPEVMEAHLAQKEK